MSTAAIAVWAVAQRLIDATQTITGQLTGALFPIVVDSSALGREDRLRELFIQGTRVSLAMVIPVVTGLSLLAEPLVMAWVGPEFSGSIAVIYILAMAVAIRVGNSTATTLLKGAGRHRLLAISNVLVAILNIGFSIALVRRMGLAGVALGTLMALAIVSSLVLFPAACRRVQMNKREALRIGVFPALWPAVVMAAFLAITRTVLSGNLVAIALQAIVGGFIYLGVFLMLAIGRDEREWYLTKAKRLLNRPRVAAEIQV
jgi:O-antigen/teichoic acid export membrane protein